MSSLKNDEVKLEVYRLYVNEGRSIADIVRLTGIPKTTISDFVNRKSQTAWWETYKDKPIAGGTKISPEFKRKELNSKRVVFTSAQNNTFVFEGFLRSLEKYCEHNGADLVVGTFTYNKSGFQNLEKDEGEWYDPKIVEYIDSTSASMQDKVVWCGELNILPTAVNPLSGLGTYTKTLSGVVPHPKVRMDSCARPKNQTPKFMYSTGAITQANYIQRKEGQKAEFHHTFGALVVEFDEDGDWFARQLLADPDGSFYDLNTKYTPTQVELDAGLGFAEAIQWGDLHSEKPSEEVYEGSFGGSGSILDTLKPKYQFCHDTLDFTTRNHHNIKDIHFRMKSQINSRDRVEDDLGKAAKVFKKMDRSFCKTVVVESNHDLALLKWLNTADIRYDNIYNVHFYHKCQVKIIEAIMSKDDSFSIFRSCVDDVYPDLDLTFLKEDDSFVICEDIECANHGHLGVNGARGSGVSFAKMGNKQNLGHAHSAQIIEGVYVAGIAGNLEQGYNKGPSSWSNSHVLTYKNGKRTMITMSGSKWRA